MISNGIYLFLTVFFISISACPDLEFDIDAFPVVGENGNGISQVYFDDEINFEVVGDFSGLNEEASYDWDFGDGITGEGVLVTHNFENLGEFLVELTITEPDGCTDVFTKWFEVTVNFESIGPGCPEMAVFVEDEEVLSNSSSEEETFDEYYVIPDGEDEINLSANFIEVGSSDFYEVESIPYQPVIPYTGVNPTDISLDDQWSEVVDLGFDFSFFDEYYNKAMIASNGGLTFSVEGEVPNGEYSSGSGTPWVIGGEIPSNGENDARYKNAIFGILQDTHPSDNYFDDWSINYQLIGEAPCRTMIFNMYNLGLYPCGNDLGPQTYQMIIYETTNVIDVQVKDRTACESWNEGNGIIGIQNQDASIAFWPEGRNAGAWEAHDEAWRFTPAGENLDYTFTWTDENGEVISSGSTITVGPGEYMAQVIYGPQNSGGRNNESGITKTKRIKVYQGFSTNMELVEDLYACIQTGEKGIFDLTQNNSVIDDESPEDFTIKYYTAEVSARSDYNPITDLENYQSQRGGQTIYVRIAKNGVNANEIGSFELNYIDSGIAHTPEDLVVDPDEDYVDLTQVNNQVLGNQNPSDFTLSFYLTEADAIQEQNQIYNPESFEFDEDDTTIWVRLEDSDGSECFDITHFILTTTMGVESFEVYTKIWPNPVSDILYVENTKESISGLTLFDLQGRIIKQTNAKELNVKELSSGVYFVEIKGTSSSYIKRVIVD